MTNNIILLSLAILPVLLLGLYVYSQDKFEKEPFRMLLKAFCFGCLSVVPAVFIETFLSGVYQYMGGDALPSALGGLFKGFVVAGFSEELCKLLLLSLAVWRSRYFDEYFDGIVYATFVSLGFAGLENILYVFEQEDFTTSVFTGTMRAILAVPGHFLFGVVMGYYFALAKFHPEERFVNILKALFFPMLLHGTYDSLLMVPEAMGIDGTFMSLMFFVLFIYFDIKLWKIGMRRLKEMKLRDELPPNYRETTRGEDNGGDNYPHDPFSGFNWNV